MITELVDGGDLY